MTTVIDADSLVAFLAFEDGGAIVRQRLREAPGSCVAHAANVCEV